MIAWQLTNNTITLKMIAWQLTNNTITLNYKTLLDLVLVEVIICFIHERSPRMDLSSQSLDYFTDK